MPISLAFVMGFVGLSIGFVLGIYIFGTMEFPDCTDDPESDACSNQKEMVWTVIGILPVALFFAIYAIFGGLSDSESTESTKKKRTVPLWMQVLLYLRLAKLQEKH